MAAPVPSYASRQSVRLSIALVLSATGGACGKSPAPQPIRFLHTFNNEETELFNQTVAERGIAVESSLVPFARGRQVIGEILRAGTDCPDLIRIDATWLPELVAGGLLVELPRPLATRDWSPEATALAQLDSVWWAVPQTVDGLLVVRDIATPAPASASLADLVAAARAARTPTRRYPLELRVDGYWLVPWLRDEGGELAPGGIAGDVAVRAMARFAALVGEVAPPPPSPGLEEPDEGRLWAERTRSPTGSPARGSSTSSAIAPGSRSARSPTPRAAVSCWSCRAARSTPTTAGGSPTS